MQVGHHLATVAHAEGEAVVTLEEALECIAGTAVEQCRLGPAFTGAEDVAVGETTAGHQAFELVQVNTAGENIAHVHVDRVETGAVECGGHFHLTVDALLTQHSHLWANAFLDVRRGDVLVDVVAELDAQARVVLFQQRIELLLGAVGVVAQALDLVAGFSPGTLQQTTLAFEHGVTVEGDVDLAIVDRLTDHGNAVTQTGSAELREDVRCGVLTNLDHRTQFFVEQDGGDFCRGFSNAVEVQAQTAVAGKGHFHHGGQQPPSERSW